MFTTTAMQRQTKAEDIPQARSLDKINSLGMVSSHKNKATRRLNLLIISFVKFALRNLFLKQLALSSVCKSNELYSYTIVVLFS